MADVKNPQTPTPLKFKGVFFTNSFKGRFVYNHVYDKLAHIKFLGIGTFEGEILPDILSAVLVKVVAGGDVVESYKVRKSSKKGSLIGDKNKIVLEVGGKKRIEGEIKSTLVGGNKFEFEIARDIVQEFISKKASIFGVSDSGQVYQFVKDEEKMQEFVNLSSLAGLVLREASIFGIASILTERAARSGMISTLKHLSLQDKEISLVHYHLYNTDNDYAEFVDYLMNNFAKGLGSFSINTYEDMYRSTVNKIVEVSDVELSSLLKEADIDVVKKNSLLSIANEMKKVISDKVNEIDQSMIEATKKLEFARIESGVQAEWDNEIERYKAILDSIYEDFKRSYEKIVEDDKKIYGLFMKLYKGDEGNDIIKDFLFDINSSLGDDASIGFVNTDMSDKEQQNNVDDLLNDSFLGELVDSGGGTGFVNGDGLYGKIPDQGDQAILAQSGMFGDPLNEGDGNSSLVLDSYVSGELGNEDSNISLTLNQNVFGEIVNQNDDSPSPVLDQHIFAGLSDKEDGNAFPVYGQDILGLIESKGDDKNNLPVLDQVIFGELKGRSDGDNLSPVLEEHIFGELNNEDSNHSPIYDQSILGEIEDKRDDSNSFPVLDQTIFGEIENKEDVVVPIEETVFAGELLDENNGVIKDFDDLAKRFYKNPSVNEDKTLDSTLKLGNSGLLFDKDEQFKRRVLNKAEKVSVDTQFEVSDSEVEDWNVVVDHNILASIDDGSGGDQTNIVLDHRVLGELSSKDDAVLYDSDNSFLGELNNNDQAMLRVFTESEYKGEIDASGRDQSTGPSVEENIFAEASENIESENHHVHDDSIIAVWSGSDPDWSFKHRPPLEKDKLPEPPEFEHVCSDFVCVDWLHFPLVEFGGDYTIESAWDENLEPRYPTGHYDGDGNPYILPPYSILNEPISNGVDVGGKKMMAINPCNLYDVISYLIKVYNSMKVQFAASDPVSSMSRVMNMLFNEIQKLVENWDITKHYTPDEMWRIYRFVRWIAIGVTNKYYRLKIVYDYEDFIEQFEQVPYSNWIKTGGAVVKNVSEVGKVLDGHPNNKNETKWVELTFNVPKKTYSSTITFDLGNYVPDRPPEIANGKVFSETFEVEPEKIKIKGDGWVLINTPDGKGLAIEHPAKARLYKTDVFSVPQLANGNMLIKYKVDTNLETNLVLKRDGEVVWVSPNTAMNWTYADIPLDRGGDFSFEVYVPQAESNSLTPILFTASQIDSQWLKTGYLTTWEVKGDTIYEIENTPLPSLIVNPKWINDTEYEFECEFMTSGGPTGMEDFLGFVFNYKDPNNYYAVGTWGRTSPNVKDYAGVWKVVNGKGVVREDMPATWKFNKFFQWEFNVWYKMKVKVKGNTFTILLNNEKVLEVTDPNGWGGGASGLIAYSNPNSTFRNFKYYSKPHLDIVIDSVEIKGNYYVYKDKPKYAIDFYLDDDSKPLIKDYSAEDKSTFSFPIMEGEHKARWVFKKLNDEESSPDDASYIDNIVIKGVKKTNPRLAEEFIGCGGHFAVKSLIDNLLEYYRRHHEACKGRRDIWIIE